MLGLLRLMSGAYSLARGLRGGLFFSHGRPSYVPFPVFHGLFSYVPACTRPYIGKM